MPTAIDDLKSRTIAIEKNVANYVGAEVEAAKMTGGDRVANELLMSVVALFAARSVAIIHVWTGEPVEAVKKRFIEAFEFNITTSVKKVLDQMLKKDGNERNS